MKPERLKEDTGIRLWTHVCPDIPGIMGSAVYNREWTTGEDFCSNCGKARPEVNVEPLVEKYEDDMTPHQALQELYELLIKSARRATYDFKHAIDCIQDREMRDLFSARSKEWLKIFQPDGMKSYRHELHMEIFNLESKITRYKDLLAENDITDTVDTPF